MWTVIATAALVAALASLTIQGLNVVRSGSAADVRQLRGQITTLDRQHQQDARAIHGLTLKVGTLTSGYGTLNTKVGVMAPTVHNLAPFANGVCSQPLQGSKGAFTATFPCKN